MARRARRYEDTPKLNVKKIIAVIVLILVIIMFVVGIKSLLESNSRSTSGKIESISYYTAYDNGKWGVIDSYGEYVIDATYDDMIIIPDSTKAVFICTYDVNYQDGTYKTKVLNEKNKEIIKGYEKVEAISNYDKSENLWYETGVVKVQKNGKFGLADFAGKEILACDYDKIESIQGLQTALLITKDGKYGVCDISGNVIIEPNYKEIKKIEDNYKNGFIVVNDEGKCGIIGFDKQEVLECKYDEIKPINSTEVFIVKQDGKYIAINQQGETILENKFDDVEDIDEENIIAKKNGKFGIIDKEGKTKVDFIYDELKFASSELCIGLKNDKYGVITTSGEEKLAFNSIDISYVSAGNFIIADYLVDNKLTSKVINSDFEEKITGIVTEVNSSKGYIRVHTEDDTYKYYNFKFEEISASSVLTSNTLFLSKKDGKYGFVDKDGNVVVDYIYDDATEQNSSGYAGIKKDELWGSIDSKGKVVVEPEYNLDNNLKIDFIGAWHLCEDRNAGYYLDV